MTGIVGLALVVILSACADDDPGRTASAEPNRTITVETTEYDFVPDVVPEFRAGDTVRFVVENTGVVPHEMQVLDSDATRLGQTGSIAPGDSTELVLSFPEAGIFQAICDVDDHLSRGQRALFEVTEADGTSIINTPSTG